MDVQHMTRDQIVSDVQELECARYWSLAFMC